MAKLKVPNRGKGPAPKLEDASNNLGTAKETIKFMSFKLDETFHKRFKQRALDEGISLTELLRRSFHYYDNRD